jgi:YesN/AraC family two-component response regulator
VDEIRILIADDQEIIRQGLAIILENQSGMSVVAQAENGERAVTMARTI